MREFACHAENWWHQLCSWSKVGPKQSRKLWYWGLLSFFWSLSLLILQRRKSLEKLFNTAAAPQLGWFCRELWKSQKTTTILWWYKLKESLQHNQQISGQSSPSKYMADLGFCSSSICQIQKLDGKRSSLDICSQSGLDVCLCFKLLYYLAVSRPFHPFPLIISVHLESSQISW